MKHRKTSIVPILLGLAQGVLCASNCWSQPFVDLEQRAVRQAVERISQSVVQLETLAGRETVEGAAIGHGPTCGLIVSQEGHILSSAYNFVQEPASIMVRVPGGRARAARIVARDRARMLVLLQVEKNEDADSTDGEASTDFWDQPLPVPEFVPRDEMQVGQYAIAVGRSLDVDQVNVSMGILSATDRIWGRAIQTDANISPLNYGGALIDLRGRVLGLLTPMSPDATTELAGSEWYDSGIGFAVPLGDLIQGVLQRMQAGESVMPGLLGITLKGQNMYTSPALIGWCPPNTPAREAGLQVGDEIIELDGKPITRQVQLRHAMGPKVAGESVAIVVRRGGKVVRVSVPLVDHVDPYELPFLGVLLQRHSTQEAVVSYVYPDSPAAKAGIQIADRLVKLAEHAPASRDAWYEAATQYSPGDDASILFERNGKKIDQTITFATQPGSVPDSVGSLTKSETNDVASEPAADKPIADKKVEELSTIRLPDEPNECFLLYPRVEKDEAPGIILWLLPPGEIDRKQVLSSWHESCSRHNFILVLPRPREPIRWHPAEVGVVRRLLEAVLSRQTTDMRRIVVGGEEAGASLACGLAFQYRERARGVVIVDAVLPRGQELRGNDPENRLEFLSVSLADSLKQKLQAKSLAPLRTMKFPIIELNQTGTAETLPSESISRILLWADTLDRL